VGHAGCDRPGAGSPGRNNTELVIVTQLDAVEDGRDGARAGRVDHNSTIADAIGHQRARDQESARSIWTKDDAGVRETADDAVLDDQGCTGAENDPVKADAGAFDGQAAYDDGVVYADADRDACAARGHRYTGAQHRADDADRFVDVQRAVARRIECVDLAAGAGLGDDVSKGPAGCGATAVVGIAADARDECAQAERLCGCGRKGSRQAQALRR